MGHVKITQVMSTGGLVFIRASLVFIRDSHVISFKATVGEGSKNKAELYALWLLLKIAMKRGLNGLQVMGDSKLVVEWKNEISRLNNLIFVRIMDRTKEAKEARSGKMESPC